MNEYLKSIAASIEIVRSNMMRHLGLHMRASSSGIAVPTSAPVNPVPCLEGASRMFDKMTNLAASSFTDRTPVTNLTEDDLKRLPSFIPENLRFRCCVEDCPYCTFDEFMLIQHISTLHSDLNHYSCPHCPKILRDTEGYVILHSMGQHLKYHDEKLYRCAHCEYFHYLRQAVEKHLASEHPDRRQFVHTVREPIAAKAVTRGYICLLCSNCKTTAMSELLQHLRRAHEVKGKFRCLECSSYSCKTMNLMYSHFASCHGGRQIKTEKTYSSNVVLSDGITPVVPEVPVRPVADTTPIWQRGFSGPRTIRGIPIEGDLEPKVSHHGPVKKQRTSRAKPNGSKLTCNVCNKFTTDNVDQMREHMLREMKCWEFSCKSCGRKFYSRSNADTHVMAAHNGDSEVVHDVGDSSVYYFVMKALGTPCEKSPQHTESPPNKKAAASKKSNAAKTTSPKKVQASSPANSIPEVPSEITKVPCEAGTSGLQLRCSNKSEMVLCPHCLKPQESLNDAKVHISLVHLRLGDFNCSKCKDTFLNKTDANNHILAEHAGDAVAQINEPSHHYVLSDDYWEKQYTLVNGNELKLVDFDSSAVPCDICFFRTLPSLMHVHKTASHWSSLDCFVTNCSFVGMSLVELRSHVDMHHSWRDAVCALVYDVVFQCGQCRMKTKMEDELLQHVHIEHKLKGDSLWEVTNAVYICCYCEIKSYTKKFAQEHCASQHAGLGFVAKLKANAKHSVATYICPTCDTYETNFLTQCEEHILEHLPFECGECSVYTNKDGFEEHQRMKQHFAPPKIQEKLRERYRNSILLKKDGKTSSLASIGMKRLRPTDHSADSPRKRLASNIESETIVMQPKSPT